MNRIKLSEQCKAAGLKSLADYINEEYNGSQTKFAMAYGVVKQQVQQWLKAKKPVLVIDGILINVIRDKV